MYEVRRHSTCYGPVGLLIFRPCGIQCTMIKSLGTVIRLTLILSPKYNEKWFIKLLCQLLVLFRTKNGTTWKGLRRKRYFDITSTFTSKCEPERKGLDSRRGQTFLCSQSLGYRSVLRPKRLCVPLALLPEIKRAEREAESDHSLPPTGDVKNAQRQFS
jgi:hypothetical protein